MVTLVILDGFGESKREHGNAIMAAGTPNLDKLKKEYPHTLINASEEYVGLIKGQMGNSEVGHMAIGSGRVNYEDITKINNEILEGRFAKNAAIIKAIKHAERHGSKLHIMGLASNGGVHAHIDHLFAILNETSKSKIKEVCIHFISDGRDTPIDSGIKFAKELEWQIRGTNARIVSLIGRVYAMDREKRYDRLLPAYEAIVNAGAKSSAKTIGEAFKASYKRKVFDEFIPPTLINGGAKLESGDSFIFFNFRKDRAREITDAITQSTFKAFKTRKINDLVFTCMCNYDETFTGLEIMYPPIIVEDSLAAVLAKNGLKQYHIAESTKYAHVTFYFNGGIEKKYPGEDRKLIESYDDISFAARPKMRAPEITETLLDAIAENKHDFYLVNFSNPDMIGHTGDFDAAVKAVAYVEKCAYMVALATLMVGGECIITADHGNIEEMLDSNDRPMASHTTNKVPFILVSERHKNAKLIEDGKLANIAPTILKLLGLKKPKAMLGDMFKT